MWDGRGTESFVWSMVTVSDDATALKTIQKAKLCQLYHPNLCPLLLFQLIWNSAIAIVPILYQSCHGSVHPLLLHLCPVSTGHATLIPPMNTHTATPCQPQTDSALGKSVIFSIIPATAQAPTSLPTNRSPRALTEKCSSALPNLPLVATVRTAPAGESTSQSEHSTHCTQINPKTHTGPKEQGYNEQERHLHYGRLKIHGRWQEKQSSGSANQPCQHFASATLLWTRFQTRSNRDLPLHLTRTTPSPSRS